MLSEIQRKKIDHLFNILDLNRNGQLQLDDFVSVSDEIIERAGLDRKSRKGRIILNKATRLFIQLVVDLEHEDLSISHEKWSNFFESELARPRGTGLLHHYIHRTTNHLFNLFDVNGDKYISLSEYAMMLSIYKIPLTDSVNSFNQLDKNKDSLISVDELINALEDFFRSSDPEAAGNSIFGKLN